MLVVVVFFPTGELPFPGYISMPPSLHTGFSGPSRPPPALSSTLNTFDCLLLPGFFATSLSHFTVSATVLSGHFLSPRVFYFTILPHFGTFMTQMIVGTPHPGSSSMPALIELSFPASAWP